MKFYIALIHSILFVLTSANEEVKPVESFKKIDIVQSLSEGFQLETWSREESACVEATKSILNGVKNNTLWATWVWDSMQLPVGTLYGSVYHLGNFDQCLQVPWESYSGLKMQYCLVDVELTDLNEYDGELIDPYDDAHRYIGAKFRHGKRLNTIFLGLCLPASCKPESIAKISRLIFGLSHLPFKDVTVDPRDCQVAGNEAKPMGYYVFWSIMLVMASTCVLLYFLRNDQDRSDSVVSKVCRCFCLTRNLAALTEVREDDIRTMQGIRAIDCCLLVGGHYFYMIQFVAIFNKADAEKALTSHPFAKMTLHSDLYVDTFLLMSGLLYFKGLMSSRSYQPFRALLKRYIRLLIPLYALSIVCMTYVLPYIGSGPAWPRLARKHYEPCAKSWWRNFLMISNKVDEGAYCSETSWYIHSDFHLTILGTVIFIVYHKYKRAGFILFGLSYVISVVVPTIWIYWKELPGLLLYDFGPESQNMVINKVYNTVYMPVYTRASTYLIGMTLGYIMSMYKPQFFRKTISKTVSILGFMLGISLMVCMLRLGLILFKREYNALGLAFLATFDKTIWSVAVCSIIAVCEYGTLPIINSFLRSKVFVPLSKISYSTYLFHTMFIYREVFSFRIPPKYDTLDLIIHGFGHVVWSYFVSCLIWLFIEAPVTNLINLIYDFIFDRNADLQTGEIKKTSKVNEVITKTTKVL